MYVNHGIHEYKSTQANYYRDSNHNHEYHCFYYRDSIIYTIAQPYAIPLYLQQPNAIEGFGLLASV